MTRTDPLPRSTSRAMAIAIAVSAALLFSTISGDLLRPWFAAESIRAVPYLRAALITLCDLALMLGLLAAVARQSPRAALRMAGMSAPLLRPLAWAALVLLPVAAVAWRTGAPAADLSAKDVLWPTLAAPLLEELFYRGLAVGALMRLAGWRWWMACLWPAACFALAHLWQGQGWQETLGVVAITGLGGLLFGWLFVRWSFNLWPPILLHVGMNTLWTVFALGDTAIGGWSGNALRGATIVLAILATFALAPKPQRRA